MKVLFVSRYGSKNLGDELIVRGLEELILEFTDNIGRFDFNLKFYNNLNESYLKNTSYTEDFKVEKKTNILYKRHLRKTFLVSKLRNLVNKRRALKNNNLVFFSEKLNESDVLIIGGGNAIYDTEKHSSSSYYFKLILHQARKRNIPIFVINVGIGPFQTNKQLQDTIKTLDMAQHITVRDKKSFDLIKNLNKDNKKVHQTVDPVLFLENYTDRKSKVQTIGICVMDIRLADYSEESYNSYLSSLEKIILYYLENSKFRISIFCTEVSDLIALEDLKLKITTTKDRIFYNTNIELSNVLNTYNHFEILLGTRMHSNIISFSQSIPFIGVGWQQKVTEFFKVVELEENMVALKEFSEDPETIILKMNKVISNYYSEINKLESKKVELKSMFVINKEILTKLKDL